MKKLIAALLLIGLFPFSGFAQNFTTTPEKTLKKPTLGLRLPTSDPDNPGAVINGNMDIIDREFSVDVVTSNQYTTLEAAVAALCPTGETSPPKIYRVFDVLTPAANTTACGPLILDFQGAGRLDPATGITVTINSSGKNWPMRQIFGGSGTVVLAGSNQVEVPWGASGGDGSSGSPWTGWESFVNGTPANTKIYFQKGNYTQATRINMKVGWDVGGAGKENSIITSSFIGDAFLMASTINGSTRVNTKFHNLKLHNTNAANTGGGYVDVAGTFVEIDNLYVQGFKYGIIFDQTKLGTIRNSQLESPLTGGVWLVNKDDHTVGALVQFTNRITIVDNQFSGGGTQLIDDGGVHHYIGQNNFTDGATQIRIAGTIAVTIENNEMQGSTAASIKMEPATLAGTGAGVPVATRIAVNHIGPVTGQPAIAVVGAIDLTLDTNNFGDSTSAKVTGTVNINKLVSINNDNGGGGATFDGKAGKHFEVLSASSLATHGDIKMPKFEIISPALVTGDFVLSAGWGTTASVGALSGNDSRFKFTVTSAGTGQAANPTITLTFDAPYTVVPVAQVVRNGGSQPTVINTWVESATDIVITFNGTPVAAETFTFVVMVMG